jgi:Uma2 family endonuclease
MLPPVGPLLTMIAPTGKRGRVDLSGSWPCDFAVYRWRRIPVDADGRIVDDFLEPPDIAIEIASPEH